MKWFLVNKEYNPPKQNNYSLEVNYYIYYPQYISYSMEKKNRYATYNIILISPLIRESCLGD